MSIPDLIAIVSTLISLGAAYGSLRGRLDLLERTVRALTLALTLKKDILDDNPLDPGSRP